MTAVGRASVIGVVPKGKGPPPHRELMDASARVVVVLSRPNRSVTRQLSGVVDTSRPAAKALTHFPTAWPCAFAIFPRPLLKVVMQSWSDGATCPYARVVSPQTADRTMTAATQRAVGCSAMVVP